MPSILPCVCFCFCFSTSLSVLSVYLFLPMPLWVLKPILCCPRIFCSLNFSPYSSLLFFFCAFFLPGLQMNSGWTEHQDVCIQFCSFPSAALCLMGNLAPSYKWHHLVKSVMHTFMSSLPTSLKFCVWGCLAQKRNNEFHLFFSKDC